jgi:uncharacterized membrane protein (DUF106 family)
MAFRSIDKEKSFNLKEVTMKKTIEAFQEKMKELSNERDRFEKEHELMTI